MSASPYNCLFAWPNHADANTPTVVTFSGGSWESALPLTNLRDPLLHKVARSTSAALASTTFDVDLGVAARFIRVLAIPRHTMSLAAKIRVRGSNSSSNFGKARQLRATSAGGKLSLSVSVPGSGAKFTAVYIKAPEGNAATSFRVRVLDGSSTVRLDSTATIAANGTVTLGASATGTSLGVTVEDGHSRLRLQTASSLAAGTHTIELWPNGATETGLDLIVSGVYMTDSSGESAFTEGGANLITAPFDFSAWTASNVSTTATGLDEPNGPQSYDTGWLDVWPVMWDYGVLPWGSPNTWTRKLTEEQVGKYRAGWVHVAPTGYQAQYWRFEIDDTTNAAGFIDLARLVMSPGYQPSVNMSEGATLGIQDESRFTESLGGVRYYDSRPQRRVQTLVFDTIPDDELLGVMQEMQRELGTSGQVFWIHAADDTFNLPRRAMLATFKELSPIEYAFVGRGRIAFTLEEVL